MDGIDDLNGDESTPGRSNAGRGAGDDDGWTSIHASALDGIVHVNSLYTLAIFLGMTTDTSDASLVPAGCRAGKRAAEDLVSFHVFAFSAYVFSSLLAVCLKEVIRLAPPHPRHGHHGVSRVNRAGLRAGMLACAAGSVIGSGCLLVALVNMVQIKLGRLGCSGAAAVAAVAPLITLVPAAMVIYVAIIIHAI